MAKLKTMTVKVMDNGVEKEVVVAVVGPGGHPVYEIDGKDVEQNVDELRSILKASNDENAARRVSEKEAKDKLAAFDGIDPVKAKEALATMENLKDKDLVDAKQIETLKANLEATWKANMEAQKVSYEAQITELNGKIKSGQDSIRNITLKNAFLSSEYLKNTIYDPVREDAFKIFGDKFEVEAGDNGDMRIVFKNPDGTPFLSTARPGQNATFDESIEHIFLNHPQKDHLMKGTQASGSGAAGGGGGGSKTTLAQLQEKLAVAEKNRDAAQVRILTDLIFQARQEGAAG